MNSLSRTANRRRTLMMDRSARLEHVRSACFSLYAGCTPWTATACACAGTVSSVLWFQVMLGMHCGLPSCLPSDARKQQSLVSLLLLTYRAHVLHCHRLQSHVQ